MPGVSRSHRGGSVTSPSIIKQKKSGKKKKAVPVDPEASTRVAANRGAEKPGKKTLLDRSLSQAGVESADSGYGSDTSIAGNDVKSKSTNGNGLIPNRTYEILQKTVRKNTTLANLKKAGDNYNSIEKYLKSDKYTAGEKVAYLWNETGLYAHMKQKLNPTSPEAVLYAIREMSEMLIQVAQLERPQRKELANKLLNADGACFEAKCSKAQEVYAREMPLNSDNDVPDVDQLEQQLYAGNNSGKILDGLLEKYTGATGATADKEAFIAWVKQKDGVMEFKAADQKITEAIIRAYCDTMIDAYVMEGQLEPKTD